MTKKATIILTVLALGVSTLVASAQDSGTPSEGGRPPHRPMNESGGPGGGQGRRPMPPVQAVLDANHDGVIDADEIANAPAALKKLDKNGDGQLTPDELRPQRPDGAPGGQPSQQSPNGN